MESLRGESAEEIQPIPEENYRFFNEPVPVAESDLEHYLEDLRRETTHLPGLVSIYQDPLRLGDKTVRIKLILVYRPEDLDMGTRSFSDVIRIIGTRNILDEHFLSVDEKILENMFKFDPLVQPQFLHGRPLSMARPQDEEIRFFYMARLLDLFAGGYLETFYRLEILRQVDTSAALAALRDLQRLLEMVKLILRKKSETAWDRLYQQIEGMLEGWLSRGIERYRDLMQVLQQVPGLLVGLVDRLNAYFDRAKVAKVRLASDAPPPQALLVTERIVTAFVEPWEPAAAFHQMVDLSRRLEHFVSVLPISFALQLHQYSSRNSNFNRHVKSCFRTEGLEGNLERPYITWDRGQLLDRYLELLVQMKESEDPSRLLLDCDLSSGSALSRATDLVSQQKSKLKLKKMLRFLQDEASWEPSTRATSKASEADRR